MSKSFEASGVPRNGGPTDHSGGLPTPGSTEIGDKGKEPVIGRVGDILGDGGGEQKVMTSRHSC